MGKFVLVVLLFAVIVYGVLRLLDARRGTRAGAARSPKAPPRRTLAPDDDEEFLRELNRRRRRSRNNDTDSGPDTPA